MVEVIHSSGGRVFRLRDNLVMENCRDFFEIFREDMGEGGVVLLDFSQIRFIDSSGIGILLKCVELSKQRTAQLQIYGLNRQLDQVFKLAGLLKVFEVLAPELVGERFPELKISLPEQ